MGNNNFEDISPERYVYNLLTYRSVKMDGDFAKLAAHESHSKNLAGFLQYRIPKASKPQIFDILDRCAKKKLTSADALNELADINTRSMIIIPRESKSHDAAYTENRVNARTRDLGPFETRLRAAKITNYLDIGCGDGSITVGMASHLSISPETTYGADIPNWAGHNHKQESVSGFTFKPINVTTGESPTYSIPMDDKSCGLISMLMVLHHIKDELIPLVFREISRILTVDGLVLIREHDSPNDMIDSLINIEHGLFEVAIESLTTGEEFGRTYFGKYRTKREWISLFETFGFMHLGTTNHSGATRGYYSLFQFRGDAAPPIDLKETPELVTIARNMGVSVEAVKQARTNADLKKMIIGGRRNMSD